MKTIATKWWVQVVVTNENKDLLAWYKFEQVEDREWEIKEKYKNEIFSKYSLTDQLNMSNEAQMIITTAQIEKRDLTEEEMVRLMEIKDAKDWIDQKRKECQDEITALN